MTLLVLDVRLPAVPGDVTDEQLWLAVADAWPKLLAWLLSFWVLAVFWLDDARALAACRVIEASKPPALPGDRRSLTYTAVHRETPVREPPSITNRRNRWTNIEA